jgi:hypothetical protein
LELFSIVITRIYKNQQKSAEICRNPQKSAEISRNPQRSAEILRNPMINLSEICRNFKNLQISADFCRFLKK